MYGLRRFGIKLGLETIGNVLSGLNNPQDSFNCIHIAGTNGKGSIASALSTILSKSGYKTGLYTSPHLVRFNERICINSIPVSDKNVIDAYNNVKELQLSGEREMTFFEYTTAMAFYEFAKQNVDWAIIETGMGGRLDATNIVKPHVSVISNLSLEHQSYLGNTITEIAGEKGGIIKHHTPVVTGVTQQNALYVLKNIANKKSAPLYNLEDHFNIKKTSETKFRYSGINNTWPDMQTSLLGNYQLDNAAVVLATCETLIDKKKATLTLKNIRKGLETNKWPGRLEILSNAPFVLIDGAHNKVAAQNLATFLSDNLSEKKLTLITGMLDDKPYTEILQCLVPICETVIITQPQIDRSLPPEKLSAIAKQITANVKIIPKVSDAIKHAFKTATPDDAICIAGSLYVIGETKEWLENPEGQKFSKRFLS